MLYLIIIRFKSLQFEATRMENMEIEKLALLAYSATEQTDSMVSYWDKDLVCRFANAELSKNSGRTKKEIIDKIKLDELLGASLFERNLPYINNALGGVVQKFQSEFVLPDGSIRYLFIKLCPDIVNGEVIGFYIFFRDISSIKLLEKELIEAKERIEEQNKRLLNFSNIVSHNFKNYAQGFSGMIKLLDEHNSLDDQAKIIGIIKKTSDNFTNTIKNLTDIVQVQNMSNIEPIAINLYDEIVKAISTLNIRIRNSHSTINNHVDGNTTILSNPAYIESILVNLLTNAIKYKHPDRDPIIELNCYKKNKEIVLTIADNGIGIDLEKYGEDLFGMYKTFHENDDANGIGLYTTKYQVETMGGHIEVESEEGLGSKFSIYYKHK